MSYGIDTMLDDCYEGTTCLINKLNIRDEQILRETEAAITFAKAGMLEQEPIQGSFDFEHYKRIHHFLFCDLYEWAGKIRAVNISKKGTNFVKHERIEALGTACLQKIQNGYLSDLDKTQFSHRIAELYHDINMLHPFREGNGRAQRAFFSQLIRHYDYDIDFSTTDTDFLMLATIYAAQGVTDHLERFFSESIHLRNKSLS